MKLAKEVYTLTAKFPRNELYGLTDQVRRSVISIPSNIAEGQVRQSPADFSRFLHYALGSLAELETQLILSQDFNYLTAEDLTRPQELILNIRKMLYGLLRSFK